jgi:Flp pilus assembly protein TadG
MRVWREESGQILPITAMCLALLLGMLAIAIDVGQLLYVRRQMQTLADSLALAGANEIAQCSGTADCSIMQAATSAAATEDGYSSYTSSPNCGAVAATGLTISVNNPPCAIASDPNNGSKSYVEVVVTMQQNAFFAGFLGFSKIPISARAESGGASSNTPCVGLTGTSGEVLNINSGTLTMSNCALSFNASTATINNCNNINAKAVNLPGASASDYSCIGSGSAIPGTVNYNTTFSNPYSSVTAPTESGLTNYTSTYSTIGSTTTLSPGIYGAINFNSGTYTVTLNSGVYYITGSWVINGGVTLNGSAGVLLYFSSGYLQSNSSSFVANLAPISSSSYGGLSYWQASSSGVSTDGSLNLTGGLYMPNAQLTVNSGSTITTNEPLVVNSLILDTSLTDTYSGGGAGGGGSVPSLQE